LALQAGFPGGRVLEPRGKLGQKPQRVGRLRAGVHAALQDLGEGFGFGVGPQPLPVQCHGLRGVPGGKGIGPAQKLIRPRGQQRQQEQQRTGGAAMACASSSEVCPESSRRRTA
jgi:hypothetical protein